MFFITISKSCFTINWFFFSFYLTHHNDRSDQTTLVRVSLYLRMNSGNTGDGGDMVRTEVKPCDLLSRGTVPKLLKKSASGESCCIFRIPESLARNNKTAYEPKIVSIGPYHRGKTHLQMVQEHKHRFLEFFLTKAKKKGVYMSDLVEAVSILEDDVRDSYSENLDCKFGEDTLIDMMILDGCFVLTLFFVVAGKVSYTELDDPIFRMPWILTSIRSDLLLLENQVPFVLLQTLFQRSKIVTKMGLNEVAFIFLNYSIEKPKDFWSRHHKLEAKHLLDLIRKTFMPVMHKKTESASDSQDFQRFVLSAKKLQLRGIKFEPRNDATTFLEIRYESNLVDIPPIALDDFIIKVLFNCVAFEQFYVYCTNHITSYVAFMGCLINSEADAMYLSEIGILENYFGTGEEVSQFFKSIGKDIVFDISKSYLSEVFEGVNKYTSRGYHVQWAGFKHTHFDSPWTCLSSFAALLLLVLTIIQAFYAVYAYRFPPKDK